MPEFVSQLLKSKTMIVNGLTLVATVLSYATGTIEAVASHPNLVTGLFTVAAIVNMLLRLVTKEPISAK